MKVKELIAKLEEFPEDMEVFWDDAIEGNDCEVEGVHKVMSADRSKTPIDYGAFKAVMISPCTYESDKKEGELTWGWEV